MSSLQSEDCQTNDPNDLFPTSIESLRFPLDNSMRIVFTGYFNGFNVEVRSTDEMDELYHMGCFGKGSASRSRPTDTQRVDSISIMRKRQFLKRNYWNKKFSNSIATTESDIFLKEVEELSARIVNDGDRRMRKDVIDLVSSDDNSDDDDNDEINNKTFEVHDKDDVVVIVPNSDSEEDNYFAKMKPKCCLNKIKLQEKLLLTLQEAFFLLYAFGCIQIISMENNILSIEQCWDLFKSTDKLFVKKYAVYHYFRIKGYIVKPGVKFGGDYLLYKEGPGIAHADYIVVIKTDRDCKNDWLSVLGHVRMANTTVKEVLIAEVTVPDEPSDMPEVLKHYSIREVLLTRNIPVSINEDD